MQAPSDFCTASIALFTASRSCGDQRADRTSRSLKARPRRICASPSVPMAHAARAKRSMASLAGSAAAAFTSFRVIPSAPFMVSTGGGMEGGI